MNKYGLFIVYKNKYHQSMEFVHDVELEPHKMLAVTMNYKYLKLHIEESTEEAAFIDWEKVILARCWKVES